MKAVILAAGRGTRLGEITCHNPKCLMDIGGRTILERQIDLLFKNSVTKIYIVIGFMADNIKKKLKSTENLIFIENREYETTENIYSLYLASNYVKGEEFFLLNGDTIFEEDIIKKLLNYSEKDVAPVDSYYYDLEELKVKVEEGFIKEILPKTAPKMSSDGSTIGIFKFSSHGSRILFDEIETLIAKNIKNKWFEYALNETLRDMKMHKLDIRGLKWVEVDTLEDIEKAKEIFIT